MIKLNKSLKQLNNPYPNRQETILLLEIEPNNPTYNKFKEAVKKWKCEEKDLGYLNWRSKSQLEKNMALSMLCSIVAVFFKKQINIEFSQEYSYSPDLQKINLGEKPSIISTLHEIAHFINGPSEIEAVHISLSIFKSLWPKAFEKLKFVGNSHVLKQ